MSDPKTQDELLITEREREWFTKGIELGLNTGCGVLTWIDPEEMTGPKQARVFAALLDKLLEVPELVETIAHDALVDARGPLPPGMSHYEAVMTKYIRMLFETVPVVPGVPNPGEPVPDPEKS